MRVALITDSLSLPRRSPEIVTYAETYAASLAATVDLMHCGIGAATAPLIANQLNYLVGSFDLYVFHFGIVDCAPRALRKIERKIMERLPVRLPKPANRWLRAHRFIRLTMPDTFGACCRHMVEVTEGKCLAFGIAPATAEYEFNVPGIGSSIDTYNDILRDVFAERVIAADFDPYAHLMSDHMHPNAFGHRWYADALIPRIHGGSFGGNTVD